MAENGDFDQNMKNRSKNRVFQICKMKFGTFDEFSTYISAGSYRKWLSSKTKKLERFFDQNVPPPADVSF